MCLPLLCFACAFLSYYYVFSLFLSFQYPKTKGAMSVGELKGSRLNLADPDKKKEGHGWDDERHTCHCGSQNDRRSGVAGCAISPDQGRLDLHGKCQMVISSFPWGN